jgi:hypothetical protein
VCEVPGCTHKAIARNLCATHCQYARRHGGWRGRGAPENPGQNGDRNYDGYDERFTGLFLDELELRGSPRYPDSPWFTALARADNEWQRLGPLKPAIKANQTPETSGLHESLLSHRCEEDLSRSVNLACSRWLARHGVPEPVWTPGPGGT